MKTSSPKDSMNPQNKRPAFHRILTNLAWLGMGIILLFPWVSCGTDTDDPFINLMNDSSTYEGQLFQLINDYRVAQSKSELMSNDLLYSLANEHSNYQYEKGTLSHDKFADRALKSGRPSCVENVGYNFDTPEEMLNGWIASQGHNQNLLNSVITMVGISYVNSYSTYFACE